MTAAAILARPGVRHSVDRELRTLAELRSTFRSAPGPRRPRLARLIAEHESHLAALAADGDQEATR